MMYHRDCDIHKALSFALGQQRQEGDTSDDQSMKPVAPSMEKRVEQVAIHLNERFHKQAEKMIERFRHLDQYTSMSISALMNTIDQGLLQFIRQVTCSKNDMRSERRRRKLFQEASVDVNEKSLKHFYALCILLFNTNRECSIPLHVVLTETVLCHGGSLELVKILNNLGAVVSNDTRCRLSSHVVQQRLVEGIKKSLVPEVLTVVSMDNIDILQPNAIVSTLDATRSWHGTSVQCLQPLPVTGTLTPEEKVSPNVVPSSSSPELTMARPAKRMRTLTEARSPSHPLQDAPTSLPSLLCSNEMSSLYKDQHVDLTTADFLFTDLEDSAFSKLTRDIHLALVMKFFNLKRPQGAIALPIITSLIHCLKRQSTESECSNVVYLDVLSQKAESKDTLLQILGSVYKTFIGELNQKWVFAIGDAKVYDVLQELKSEYGEALKWLHPFPGDWHVLFNFQKVLMKPYADAGLLSLGSACGYRAETLTSVKKASNFRRTHLYFILQCFEALYQQFLELFCKSLDTESVNRLQSIAFELIGQFSSVGDTTSLAALRASVTSHAMYDNFMQFVKDLSKKHDNTNVGLSSCLKTACAT